MTEFFNINTKKLECELKDLLPINIVKIEDKNQKKVWGYLVNKYHYLGYKGIIGKQLKYLIYSNNQIIAASGWKTGSLNLEARDKFIGWNQEEKQKYLDHIINNTRYLLMPWVKTYNLASYLLSRLIKQVAVDWENKYEKEVLLFETFIDPRYYQGTCYKAANWFLAGKSKGYRKGKQNYQYHGAEKEVYLYVIKKNFREIIGCSQRFLSHKPTKVKLREEKSSMMLQKMDYDPNLINWQKILPDMISKLSDELVDFYNSFKDFFRRVEQEIYAKTYLKGLLSNEERKNIERIALRYLEPEDVRGMQKFFNYGKWDDEGIARKQREILSSYIAAPDGMITVDSSEIPKKGKESVGVFRQYCGNTGKIDNCQSGVFAGYTSLKGYGLAHAQLYLPEIWFSEEYTVKRKKCGVPEELSFKTKIEIALEEIKEMTESGLFPGKWIGCDASFGCDIKFRDEIDKLGRYYFARVKGNQLVWLKKPKVIKHTYKGRGRYPKEGKLIPEYPPISIKDIIKNEKITWQSVVLAEGSKGPITGQVARLRIYENRDGLPGKQQWLFIRKRADGNLMYYFSNAPESISMKQLIQASTWRWPIEQCFEDGKKYLGMDHYEHRSWIAWHRHMIFIMLTLLFLMTIRIKYKKKIQQTHYHK